VLAREEKDSMLKSNITKNVMTLATTQHRKKLIKHIVRKLKNYTVNFFTLKETIMKRKKIIPPLRQDIEAPDVFITPGAYLKVRALVDLCDKEVGWMGSVENAGDEYTIYDIHMFAQEVHAAETDIDATSIGKVAHDLIQEGKLKEVNEMHFWGHSHVNMGVSPSAQDVDQAYEFEGNGVKYFICGIFNKKGEMTIDFYDYEHQEVWQELPLKLGSPDQIANIRAEMKQLIKEHVTDAKSYSKSGNIQPYGAWDIEDDLNWYNNYGGAGYYNRYGGHGKPSGVPANQAGGAKSPPVGQGHGGRAQRGKPVVHTGSGGAKQSLSPMQQLAANKSVSGNNSKSGVLDPEKPKINGDSNPAGGQYGTAQAALGSTP